jgi:ABC-2 type transport system ATP-binding protein
MSEKLIEIENLRKQYGNFTAVDNIGLNVVRGDVYGFLGPNGAGKSTTIRMMLSLVKPTSGSIKIFGKPLNENRNEILRNIGCIIEKPDFYLYLSALKNLELFGAISGKKITRQKIYETLELVGLSGRGNDLVKTFSHGMKQRLGIAQTLLHDPELIVLDEPTTGLDPQGIIDIRHLILRLKKELGKTIVLSSHILSEVELIASRMIIINKGRAVVEGSVDDLLSNEDLYISIETNKNHFQSALANTLWIEKLVTEERTDVVKLKGSKDEIPALVKTLQENKIIYYKLTYQRTLEDFFLKLTAA